MTTHWTTPTGTRIPLDKVRRPSVPFEDRVQGGGWTFWIEFTEPVAIGKEPNARIRIAPVPKEEVQTYLESFEQAWGEYRVGAGIIDRTCRHCARYQKQERRCAAINSYIKRDHCPDDGIKIPVEAIYFNHECGPDFGCIHWRAR